MARPIDAGVRSSEMRPSIPLLLAAQRVRCRTGFFFCFFCFFFELSALFVGSRPSKPFNTRRGWHVNYARLGLPSFSLLFCFFLPSPVAVVALCFGCFTVSLFFFHHLVFLYFFWVVCVFFFNYARLGLGSLYLAHCGFQFRRVLGLARFTEMLLLLLLLLLVVVVA